MESIVNYMEPRDIYEKIGTNASELSEAEHGFICGLIRKYKPKKIVELGVSGGGTSVLVLNCLQKLGLNDTKMYSVDLSETYLRHIILIQIKNVDSRLMRQSLT